MAGGVCSVSNPLNQPQFQFYPTVQYIIIQISNDSLWQQIEPLQKMSQPP